jgi:hypothetical protein
MADGSTSQDSPRPFHAGGMPADVFHTDALKLMASRCEIRIAVMGITGGDAVWITSPPSYE